MYYFLTQKCKIKVLTQWHWTFDLISLLSLGDDQTHDQIKSQHLKEYFQANQIKNL